MPETYDLEIVPISTYLFELPGTPEGEDIEVTISFFRDTKERKRKGREQHSPMANSEIVGHRKPTTR